MNHKIKPYIYIVAIVLFVIYILFGSDSRKVRLQYLDGIRSEYVKGIITAKYIDRNNHNYQIIKSRNSDGKEIVWFLNYDISSFFEQVSVGDSIIKRKNSIKIMIVRRNIKKEYTLDFKTD